MKFRNCDHSNVHAELPSINKEKVLEIISCKKHFACQANKFAAEFQLLQCRQNCFELVHFQQGKKAFAHSAARCLMDSS